MVISFSNVEPTRSEQLSVTATSSVISAIRTPALPRKVILVRNISGDGTRISVTTGNNTAVANQGIILEDGEDFQESSMFEDGRDVFQGQYSAIASTANGKLSIFER